MVTEYKFNGKEKDEETGMYYYGARYYPPDLGIWLSVDPLSDKYPSMSSYSYCAGNPVLLIDPTGNGGEVSKIRDANGQVTGVRVSATVFIYGEKATDGLASELQGQINNQWNQSGTMNYQGKDYNVQFDIKVQTVSYDEASRLADDNTDRTKNFLRVFDTEDGGFGSKFYGNSGMLNLSQNTERKGTSVAHEIGHMLGFRSNNTDDNTHFFDANPDGTIPMMYVGPNSNKRQVTSPDVGGLNLFNGLFGSPRQSKIIGEQNNNRILRTQEELKGY
ncbi:MAG: hypothetical protein PHT69_01010 [Bacteroidales bacterium]|nr:hypothetical protein [Bacteroidales bacterium]